MTWIADIFASVFCLNSGLFLSCNLLPLYLNNCQSIPSRILKLGFENQDSCAAVQTTDNSNLGLEKCLFTKQKSMTSKAVFLCKIS